MSNTTINPKFYPVLAATLAAQGHTIDSAQVANGDWVINSNCSQHYIDELTLEILSHD